MRDSRLLHQVMKPGKVEPGNWKFCLFSEDGEFTLTPEL